MNRWSFFFIVVLFPVIGYSQQPVSKYPVSAILPELLSGADMVIRLKSTEYRIVSLTTVVERVHLVYTILRESGREKAGLQVFYDKDTRIGAIKGKVYRPDGSEIPIRSSEFTDLSAVPSGTLYSDDRVKVFGPTSVEFPYTVEYEYERTLKNLVVYPSWVAVEDLNVAVELSRLTVKFPDGNAPGCRAVNFPEADRLPKLNADSTRTWEVHSLPAFESEPLSIGLSRLIPIVYLAPAAVAIPDQAPLPVSWQSVGSWLNWLNKDRDMLPPEVTAKILALVAGDPDRQSRMRKIYHYFQQTTRYISVQIGIGGLQPATAEFVAENGYGDCKALVNYMKALLNCAGIPSCYTLIRAGDDSRPVITDFPCLQFNHVILCVPEKDDTIWLECTSQVLPFGFLGSFTHNRQALILKPDGGHLVRTPKYSMNMNRMTRKATVTLDDEGNARIGMTTLATGLQYEPMAQLVRLSPDKQKQSFREDSDWPMVNISSIGYVENPGMLPEASEHVELEIPKFASKTGDRLFLPLNPFNRISSLSSIAGTRKHPFSTGYGYVDTDTIEFILPEGFTVEGNPEMVQTNTKFGLYEISGNQKNRSVVFIRHCERMGGEFPAERWETYFGYRKKLAKSDKSKLVIKLSTNDQK